MPGWKVSKTKYKGDRTQTYGAYDTSSYQNLDGTSSAATSTALEAGCIYRMQAYTADCWISIGANPTAVAEQGLFMAQYDEITLTVNASDKISVIGGKLNIVPVD